MKWRVGRCKIIFFLRVFVLFLESQSFQETVCLYYHVTAQIKDSEALQFSALDFKSKAFKEVKGPDRRISNSVGWIAN